MTFGTIVSGRSICIIKRESAEIDRLRVIMLMRPDYDEGSK